MAMLDRLRCLVWTEGNSIDGIWQKAHSMIGVIGNTTSPGTIVEDAAKQKGNKTPLLQWLRLPLGQRNVVWHKRRLMNAALRVVPYH